MLISIIVAIGNQNQLGLDNKLLWQLPDDLKNFKLLTSNHHILMGRKTFESIGKALPNRTNIIITRNSLYNKYENTFVFNDIEKAVNFAKNNNETELFIIGGSEIYKFFLDQKIVEKIYLTKVDYSDKADVFFPKLNYHDWIILDKKQFKKDDKNQYKREFLILEKKYI